MGDDKNSIADLLTLATTSQNIILHSLCLRELTSSSTRFNPCFPLRRTYLFILMLSHHPSFKSTSLRA